MLTADFAITPIVVAGIADEAAKPFDQRAAKEGYGRTGSSLTREMLHGLSQTLARERQTGVIRLARPNKDFSRTSSTSQLN
ncbi:hypothetical protein BU17DRAFT_92851 [Hysterangium stoloniferum]|nr:hypothetical protein BU17DRAFT_92851 [Hysterangium stoloniferum]